MTKISRDQLRRIIRETKASVDAESSKKSTLSETTRKDIASLNEAKKAVVLHEARLRKQLDEYIALDATITTATEITTILESKINEAGFFKNLGRVASQAVGSWPGFGKGSGGESPEEVESSSQMMKDLNSGLKMVTNAEKAVKSIRMSDTNAFGDAVMKYVKSLTDLYMKFKGLENEKYTDRSGKEQLTYQDIFEKIAAAYKSAREYLGKLTLALQLASDELYAALKGTPMLSLGEPDSSVG